VAISSWPKPIQTVYPGSPEDLIVTTDSETLVEWNLRRITLEEAAERNRCRLEGAPGYVKAFPSWVRPSPFANVYSAAWRPAMKGPRGYQTNEVNSEMTSCVRKVSTTPRSR
jgi:hypothetical protein